MLEVQQEFDRKEREENMKYSPNSGEQMPLFKLKVMFVLEQMLKKLDG